MRTFRVDWSASPGAPLVPNRPLSQLIAALPPRSPSPRPVSLAELEAVVDLHTIADLLGVSVDRVRAGCGSLVAGETMASATRALGVPPNVMAIVSAYVGWSRSWVEPHVHRVGRLLRSEVIERLTSGEPAASIAQDAGVSRSRVGQAGDAAGVSVRSFAELRRAEEAITRVERQAEQAGLRIATRADVQAKRQAAFAARWMEARRMWDAGASIDAIAAAHGIPPNSMSWHIHRARSWLGAEWFPHRDPVAVRPKPQPIPDIEEIRRRWLADEPVEAIADGVGISTGTLLQRMHRARKRFGRDYLPLRVRRRAEWTPAEAQAAADVARVKATAYLETIGPLWAATTSRLEIAQRLGVTEDVVAFRMRQIRKWLGVQALPHRER